MPRLDAQFDKWMKHHYHALWNVHELLMAHGQDVFGMVFLQACGFFEFASFVSPEIDKSAIYTLSQAKQFAP